MCPGLAVGGDEEGAEGGGLQKPPSSLLPPQVSPSLGHGTLSLPFVRPAAASVLLGRMALLHPAQVDTDPYRHSTQRLAFLDGHCLQLPLEHKCSQPPWTEEPGRLQSTGWQSVRHA